jgi:hypothetical protein
VTTLFDDLVHLDAKGAQRAKEDGMSLVEEGAPPGWMAIAIQKIREVCIQKEFFNADDVWRLGLPKPEEGRAFGPAMMHAARLGLCEKTGAHQQTTQTKSHAAPIAIWKSLLYRKAAQNIFDDLKNNVPPNRRPTALRPSPEELRQAAAILGPGSVCEWLLVIAENTDESSRHE